MPAGWVIVESRDHSRGIDGLRLDVEGARGNIEGGEGNPLCDGQLQATNQKGETDYFPNLLSTR